jgi:hypothetical protein
MAPLEEIWDPVTHRTNIEIQVRAERLSPAPLPGDPPDVLSRRGSRGGAAGPAGA